MDNLIVAINFFSRTALLGTAVEAESSENGTLIIAAVLLSLVIIYLASK